MGPMSREILDQFRRFRRRHLWVRGWDLFLEAAFVMTVTAGAMLLALRLAFELGFASPQLARPETVLPLMGGAVALSIAFAAATLILRPTPPARIAWELDRAAGGEERFLSALELAAGGNGGPFAAALFDDAVQVARRAEPSRALPRVPVGYRWGIGLSLAAAAALTLFPPRVYDAPAADFAAGPLRGPAPLEVTFSDTSVGAIDEFLWDFGDGRSGAGERVTHLYEKPGRYAARLRIEGPGGASGKSVEIEVLSADRAVAEFEAEPVKGRAPLEVRFRNLSRNGKRHAWDFGDGATSTEAEPSHLYAAPDLYTVKLRVENDLGADERVRGRYIKVAHPDEPLADFRALPREGPAPLTVDFEDLSTGAAAEWLWDFGDLYAGSSLERNPSYVYKVPGHYTVRLRVKGPHGEDAEEKLKYIHVQDEGRGRAKGGGGMAAKPPATGGAGKRPGRDFGEKSARPPTTVIPEGVKPHAPGGPLTEKTKLFGKTAAGGEGASDVTLGEAFPEYRRAAEDSIDRERIPPAMRETVRRYFNSIHPR